MHGICLRQRDNSRSLERCFVAVDGICCRRMLVEGTAEVQVRDPCTLAEVAHVTRDSGTTFKVKRSKVKVTLTGHRRVNASGSCSGERGNVLAVETTATLRSARRFGAHGRGRPLTAC